jgi:hypothetical protein
VTTTGEVLQQAVTALVRVARRPGGLLLRAATSLIALFALLGAGYGIGGTGWGGWVPLALAVVLAVPVAVLAIRRERLQSQTAGLDPQRTVTAMDGSVIVYGSERVGGPGQDERDLLSAAMAENAVRTARFFPRIEAAQRAGLLAAGGPANAPYLRDDLRVTVAALLGTLAAVPLATVGSVVTAILLLSR